jgi:hypothetical protein
MHLQDGKGVLAEVAPEVGKPVYPAEVSAALSAAVG